VGRPITPEQAALDEAEAFAAATPDFPPLLCCDPVVPYASEEVATKVTMLNKALIGLCVILALTVLYLTREEVTGAGPRNIVTRIHNRWTGTVIMCGGGECRQVYPAVPEK